MSVYIESEELKRLMIARINEWDESAPGYQVFDERSLEAQLLKMGENAAIRSSGEGALDHG